MNRNHESPDPAKVILIDKPYEWTSFGVVKKVRYLLKLKKVGHAGTLDPLATGLLILCTGKMTKKINDFMGLPKEYTGTLVLGKTTPSHDLETEIDQENDISHITPDTVNQVLDTFKGEIQQIPPQHSAVKVDGKRAYKSARKGENVKIEPRKVTIMELEAEVYLPEVKFRVLCSKGTYIRSLVRDIGEQLGVGAYLSELRRTKIGDHSVEDAYTLNDFEKEVHENL